MSAARDLAKLGNQDALTVDTTLTRVGINSSNPTATLDIDGTVQVGTGVTVYSDSGIVSATKYYADSYYGSGVNLTGVGNTDYIITGTAATFNNKVNINSTLTCSEGLNVTVGVITAPSASFSGNVTIGGTLTYEDVTNIDVVGVSTFAGRMNVNSSALFNEGINVTTGVTTIGGTSTFAKKATVNATLEATEGIKVTGVSTIPSIQGEVTVGSAVTIGSAGIATFSGGVDFNGGSILKEKVNIVAGKASDNTNINLSYGQVWHFTTVETANFVPNIMSNTGINTGMEIGDTISVSIATSCAAVSWAATVTVDGAAVNEQKWGGGSAPTEGGASGHDLYTHNVIKTAANTYTVLSNVTNFG